MVKLNPLTWWRRFLRLPNESRMKTLLIALFVALGSAVAVSVTAVTLKPLQQANMERQRQAKMETMLATLPGMADLLRAANGDFLETVIVDLRSARIALNMDPGVYDFRAAMSDPQSSTPLARDIDSAGLGNLPYFMPVYILRRNDALALVVLPVYGSGYQSTIHAYLALRGDLNTVAALQIYEQGETPGLGARIADPQWQALWPGREIADHDGIIRLSVASGGATNQFEVDGITGATRSTTGVTKLVQFWLGDHGFGPFLSRLKAGEI